MKKKKTPFKMYEIQLPPTLYTMDLWLCNDLEGIPKAFSKRYGASTEYYKEEAISNNFAAIISPTPDAPLKETRLVCFLTDFSNLTVIHEANHIVYKLFKVIGQEICQEVQELHCIFLEYITDKIFKTVKEFTDGKRKA